MPGAPLSITVRIQRLERQYDELVQQLETTPSNQQPIVTGNIDVIVRTMSLLRERRDDGLDAPVTAIVRRRLGPGSGQLSQARRATRDARVRQQRHAAAAARLSPVRTIAAAPADTSPTAPVTRQIGNQQYVTVWPLPGDPKAPPTVLNQRGGERW